MLWAMRTCLKTRWADRVGALAGTACVAHCALTPILIALVPAGATWWLASERYHDGALVFLALLALGATWWSTRRHRRFYAWFFVVPGLAALLASMIAPAKGLETILVVSGGTLVVAGHLLNLKLAHGHIHDSSCGHS